MLLKKDDSLVLLVDVQEKLVPAISDSEAVIDRCAWVLKLANKMDVPVLASEHYPKGLGPIIAPLKLFFSSSNCVEKIHFSCMQEINYTRRLTTFKKNQLILIGIEAHVVCYKPQWN